MEACQIGEPRWYPLVFRPFAGQIGEPHWYPLVFHTSGLTNWASLDARVRLLANRASSLPSKKETKMGSTVQIQTALPFGREPHFKVSSLPNKAPKIASQSGWGFLRGSRFGCRFGFPMKGSGVTFKLIDGKWHSKKELSIGSSWPPNHHQSLLQCSGVGLDVNLFALVLGWLLKLIDLGCRSLAMSGSDGCLCTVSLSESHAMGPKMGSQNPKKLMPTPWGPLLAPGFTSGQFEKSFQRAATQAVAAPL